MPSAPVALTNEKRPMPGSPAANTFITRARHGGIGCKGFYGTLSQMHREGSTNGGRRLGCSAENGQVSAFGFRRRWLRQDRASVIAIRRGRCQHSGARRTRRTRQESPKALVDTKPYRCAKKIFPTIICNRSLEPLGTRLRSNLRVVAGWPSLP